MKLKWLFLLILPFAIESNAQSVYCSDTLSQTIFQKNINQLTNILNEKTKLNDCIRMAQKYCLTSEQAFSLSKQLKLEDSKLNFLEAAYKGIRDKGNFYLTLNTFTHFSYAFRLYDFTKDAGNKDSNLIKDIQFPKIIYPDSKFYKGAIGCGKPVDKKRFKGILKQILSQKDATTKTAIANTLVSKSCISTSQAMKIAFVIQNPNNESVFLKNAYQHIYDKENYGSAEQLLSNPSLKKDFKQWLNKVQSKNDSLKQCKISPAQFDSIKTKIDNEAFKQDKINLAKKLVRKNKCFTSSQIKEIVSLFEFDDTKLEVAEYCYDFCTNKPDFYLVADAFHFSKGKNELIEFANGKNKQ